MSLPENNVESGVAVGVDEPVCSVVLSVEEVMLDNKVAVLVASNELEDEIAYGVEEAVVDRKRGR